MRLTLHTDYAIRVLVHVGLEPGRLVTISEIADSYGISKNHLTKVVHRLGRAGYLETVRGKSGGVRLSMAPEALKLGDLVRRTEEDFCLARCQAGAEAGGMPAEEDGEEAAPCRLEPGCLARQAFAEGLGAFFSALDRYTLADILAVARRA